MTYGSETWASPSAVMERLDYAEGDLLRLLLGDGPAESSAGYGSVTSSTSLAKLESIWDDNDRGTKRVEKNFGSARPVETIQISLLPRTEITLADNHSRRSMYLMTSPALDLMGSSLLNVDPFTLFAESPFTKKVLV
ncbi:hypothetical protein RB195_014202 [Necator americanus]|uniref:Uncharacterized protein n=1 Tax=Necator americanus TaxID=51031 RepID=A0ABR1DZ35_NECAM